ncbi:PH domain leucine-rich repeat-containing protein phosphatase 1-like [Schistocerca gregaria]|uniref:PH domain leucine-rich repeat-containing protein phosphatase 1-like n=1 Tax=Schistocerca gregaria TaxID=7010 RepID=UPI00211ED797|nr:PH domain leucine-rich repeat-containing protein phosphatase 1-like [Schistocerca gregaria]
MAIIVVTSRSANSLLSAAPAAAARPHSSGAAAAAAAAAAASARSPVESVCRGRSVAQHSTPAGGAADGRGVRCPAVLGSTPGPRRAVAARRLAPSPPLGGVQGRPSIMRGAFVLSPPFSARLVRFVRKRRASEVGRGGGGGSGSGFNLAVRAVRARALPLARPGTAGAAGVAGAACHRTTQRPASRTPPTHSLALRAHDFGFRGKSS